MRKSLLLMGGALLLLTACGKPADRSGTAAPTPPPGAESALRNTADANGAPASEAAPAPVTGTAPPVDYAPQRQEEAKTTTPSAPMLAYAYHLGLALPADAVRPMMESHEEACERAGPTQCQVMGANADADDADHARARLELRATPAWMRAFRGRLQADADDAGGRILTSGTNADDMTGTIVDTDATLSAYRGELATLRDQLRRHQGDLDASLEIQERITEVQQKITAAQSQNNIAENRVAMASLVVEYQSDASVRGHGAVAPIAEATKNFGRNMAWVFAFLINIASVLAPIGLVAAPVVWLTLRFRKRPEPAKPEA